MHKIWIGNPMPSHLQASCLRWEETHPDWQFMLWTETQIDDLNLQNRALYDQAEKLVPRDAVEQFRADIVRYEVLLAHGGMYTDADTYPLRRIDPALEGHAEFAAYEDQRWIGNTYIGVVPNHPIMRTLVSEMPANVTRRRGSRPNKLSGPQYLTPIWRRFGGYVAPQRSWYPYSYTDVKRGTVPNVFDTAVYAVHSWDHTKRVMEARTSGGH